MTPLADAMRVEPPTVDLTAYIVAAGKVRPLPAGRVPWAGQHRPTPPLHVPVGWPLKGRRARTDDALDHARYAVRFAPTFIAGLRLEAMRAAAEPQCEEGRGHG